mgnify:CR=1 FL=1
MTKDESTAVSLGMMAMGMPPMGGMPTSLSDSAGPSSAAGYFGSTQSGFDTSGWTISFGGNASAATGDRGGLTQTPNAGTGLGQSLGFGFGTPSMGGLPVGAVLLGVAVLAVLLVKKRKG